MISAWNQRRKAETRSSAAVVREVGRERGVAAKADSRVERTERWRGKKLWVSGEEWPIRRWSSKRGMEGCPGRGRRGREKSFRGRA